jgi:ATP-dependent DNA helicase RecQ
MRLAAKPSMPHAERRHGPVPRVKLPPALQRSLRQVFGLHALREGQAEVIRRVMNGQDTLALMPAGAGKSLCYQLPALHLAGTTVVVSPLIALMRDQAAKLADTSVAVDQFNSAVPAREQAAGLERMEDGHGGIVFTTPERLTDPDFLALLQRHPVALFVVDEAHCISQWGHDFRPAFLEIGQALQALGKPPVLALTATAPPQVTDDIRHQLGRPALHVVDTGLYRANLRLQVVSCVREGDKLTHTLEALGRNPGAGIVYTATVKACEELHEALLAAGQSVTRYHGRLPQAERTENQDRFMRGEWRVMVATNAFGMGIDRPDLRFVMHYQLPGSPEAYYQEAGRAGRDGAPADVALLFDRRDQRVQQFFLARRYPDADELRHVHAALAALPEPAPVARLAEALPRIAANHVAVALQVLREARLAQSDRHRHWHSSSAPPEPEHFEALAQSHVERAERDRSALERMVFYAQTGLCRWRVLLEHFGEALGAQDGRCGHCDNCLRPPPAPAEPADAPPAVVVAPRWARGAQVETPRHGVGEVIEASAEEVTLRFADGSSRSYLASFLPEPSAGGT